MGSKYFLSLFVVLFFSIQLKSQQSNDALQYLTSAQRVIQLYEYNNKEKLLIGEIILQNATPVISKNRVEDYSYLGQKVLQLNQQINKLKNYPEVKNDLLQKDPFETS
jgi:hypothetical protein